MVAEETERLFLPDIPKDVKIKLVQGHDITDEGELLQTLISFLHDGDDEVKDESRKTIKRLWERLFPFFSSLSKREVDILEDSFDEEPYIREWIKKEKTHHHVRESGLEKKAARPLTKEFLAEKEVYTEEDRSSIYKRIMGMSVIEKIKLALMGNREVRSILIRDSNKLVATTVMKNPRLTEDEVVRFVQSKNICDDVLRIIATSREWTKNYHVKLGLVNNPKTPISQSLKFLSHIHEKDLQHLSKSKNIPTVIMTTARKLFIQKGKS